MIPFASQRKDANEVLTSIRRMVSEEARSKAESEAAAALTELADAAPLMLTPDQAVETDAPEAARQEETTAMTDSAPMSLRAEMTVAGPETAPVSEPAAARASGEVKNLLTDDFEADDAPLMSEAKLREMVRAVIVEELQGDLGERMTRNIRKLIRQEIRKAFEVSS